MCDVYCAGDIHEEFNPLLVRPNSRHQPKPKFILYIILPSVCLYALTLYQATDCSAATDISGVTGCWQLSH